MKKLGFVVGIVGLAGSIHAYGAGYPWRIEPEEVLSSFTTEHLLQYGNTVENHHQVESILLDISRSRPMDQVTASLEDGKIVFRVVVAKPISAINVTSTSYSMESYLSQYLQRFVGLVPADEIMTSMTNETLSVLAKRGFFLAKTQIKRDSSEQWSTIEVKVDEDYPCRIRQIIMGFTLPEELKIDLHEGDICDREKIDEAIEAIDQELVENGYNQRRILSPEIEFDKGSNSALIMIPGTLGDKIIYNIDSPVQVFIGDNINQVENVNTDPEAMRSEIIRNYRNAGYDGVLVSQPVKTIIGANQVRYDYKVIPGIKYIISDISFQGVQHLGEEYLRDILHLDGLFATPLNQEEIQKGVENLIAAYQEQGFWEVDIPYPRVTKNQESGASKLVFVISEGKQRVYTELITQGNHVFTNKNIENLLPVEPASPLPFVEITAFDKSLQTQYKNSGYLYVKTGIELIQDVDYRFVRTRVMVTIDEGTRVRFGPISIQGLVDTDEVVVKRELRFSPGEWYDPDLVEETRLALVKLGIFANVSIEVADSAALSERRDTIPLTISLREGKPGSVSFGPGWSIDDGPRYVTEASYSNLGGTGRKIFFKGKVSAERQQEQIANKTLIGRFLSVGYIEPYMFKVPLNGIASLSHKAQANQKVWLFTNGGELSVNHTFLYDINDSSVSAFYAHRLTHLETNDIQQHPLIFTGDTQISETGLRFDVDDRNNLSWTTSGLRVGGEVAWADYSAGGDVGYFRWLARSSFFVEVIESWTLAFKLSLTSFSNVTRRGTSNIDILPTSERLFAGGSDSNRGFRARELGPYFEYWDHQNGTLDDRLISGGSSRVMAKVELRHRFSEENFGVAAFWDSSNVFFSPEEERRFRKGFATQSAQFPIPSEGEPQPQESALKENLPYPLEKLLTDPSILIDRHYISYGLAFSLFTPIGPIDISYGIPYRRCPPALQECLLPRGARGKTKLQSGAFHINIGSNF